MQRRFVNRYCSSVGTVVLVCLFAGCRVALISDYDATTDQWITELQQTIDAHLSTLESLSTDEDSDSAAIERCQPGRFADTFRNIDARLRSLILRNEVRAKNTLTVEQLRLLQSSIGKLQQQQIARYAEADRSNNAAGCLSSEQVQVNREILEQHIRAVLKLELSKHDFRGD
jgi:hypothetical protein